ncbi:MAG: acyl-CoA dehydrogenase family protein [Candidatus Nealsonbacteria bacterium]|nr:acyl-CoA dehydrogenase family protein [Candidatus Nealsonbacteria bacterium]
MDFRLSEEHAGIRNLMREFAEKEVRPRIKEFEEKGKFPKELVEKLGEMGFMGIFVPEQYGGMGSDILAYAIAEEELARVWASLALIMSANNSLSGAPILEWGNEDQKKKYLASLAQGKALGCYALTEPDAGSDVTRIKTRAVRNDNGWVINGTKQFITNVAKAKVCVLIARTSDHPHHGLSAFIVETSTPGFSVPKIEKKMGLHCSPTSPIVLTDCQVSHANMLGQEGDGWKVAMQTLNGGRINIAAQAVGIAQGAFEEAVNYARNRQMFGKRLIDLQDCQHKLAKMEAQIEASRWLTWYAAWQKDQGHDVKLAAARAKWFATEMVQKITYDALQIHGGMGYMDETPVERMFRDARALTLYEGASEVQLEVLSRKFLK